MSKEQLNYIINSFNIKAECVDFSKINNYCYFDLALKPKGKVKDIQKYSDEISLHLRASSKPNIKILHEKGLVRLEFVSKRQDKLNFYDYLLDQFTPNYNLPCLLGETIDSKPVWMDISKNPHMLIAGTTGSGKTVLLHTIIANCLFNFKCKLFLIDPKKIEFSEYENKIPVLYNYSDTINLFDKLIEIMNYRYDLLKSGNVPMSFLEPIVVIIDEFADLIMQDSDNKFYNNLCNLAQKCRAANIYLIISTQRPSANIINGNIKANFPARISCKVSSNIDSKIILDSAGAEDLLGSGDALIKDHLRSFDRFQVAFVDPKETVQRLAL